MMDMSCYDVYLYDVRFCWLRHFLFLGFTLYLFGYSYFRWYFLVPLMSNDYVRLIAS